MSRRLLYFTRVVAAVIAALLTFTVLQSCSGGKSYKISGDTVGGKEMTVRMAVYSPSGVRQEVLATRSGHFDYEGAVADKEHPVYIEFYTHDYKILGVAEAAAGSELSVTIDPQGASGFRVKDKNDKEENSFARVLTSWLENQKKITNGAISAFVRGNAERPVAYAVLTTLYDASQQPDSARALVDELGENARPAYYDNGFMTFIEPMMSRPPRLAVSSLLCGADTMFTLDATKHRATFLVFATDGDVRNDSVVPLLQKTAENAKKKNILVVEQNLAIDTTTWRRGLRNDTRTLKRLAVEAAKESEKDKIRDKEIELKWVSLWSGGGAAAPYVTDYSPTRLPYYIVADSTAAIRYSGVSASAAVDTLSSLTK